MKVVLKGPHKQGGGEYSNPDIRSASVDSVPMEKNEIILRVKKESSGPNRRMYLYHMYSNEERKVTGRYYDLRFPKSKLVAKEGILAYTVEYDDEEHTRGLRKVPVRIQLTPTGLKKLQKVLHAME
jgi:hypothetical protein